MSFDTDAAGSAPQVKYSPESSAIRGISIILTSNPKAINPDNADNNSIEKVSPCR